VKGSGAVLVHALPIDSREDGSFYILVVTQIALDSLTQKLGARESCSLLKFTGELFGGQGLDRLGRRWFLKAPQT
jgi:uncharacterized membrane protein